MTPNEVATILRQFNEWRRGDEDIPQFDPRQIGEAIDAAVDMIERLERVESALRIAVRQNSHDMLMTSDELRLCEAARADALGDGGHHGMQGVHG